MSKIDNVSVLIKPASAACNMNCDYCFYKDEAENREIPCHGKMSSSTADTLIKKFLAFAEKSCHFAFQGGEPTLAGIEFFSEFVNSVKKFNADNITVTYSLQTNGLALNKEWADFFRANDFLIGVSLDGSEALNDIHRKDISGNGTYQRVAENIEILKNSGCDYNILCVVTNENSEYANEIIDYFVSEGVEYLQFIPCLDGIKKGFGNYLTEENYQKFLVDCIMKVASYPQDKAPHIRHIDNLVALLSGGVPESCNMCGNCTIQFVTEADGDVYPCDFYCTDEYLLGNINTDTPESILNSEKSVKFIKDSLIIPDECRACEYYPLCRNGCRRERINGKTIHCKAFLHYYNSILRRAKQ